MIFFWRLFTFTPYIEKHFFVLSTPYIVKTGLLLFQPPRMTTLHIRRNYLERESQPRREALWVTDYVREKTCSSDMEEESEPGNEDASYLEKQDIPYPWLYLRELFEVVGSKNDSWRMHCVSFWRSRILRKIWINTYR